MIWVCMHACNFLTEPDTDILMENKNVPYGWFSPYLVKKNYVYVCNFLIEPEAHA